MATTIQQIEAAPINTPHPPSGLSAAALALDPFALWARLEAFIAYRWAPREVRWTVEGPGLWAPPLVPAVITTTERWSGEAWENVILPPSAFGGFDLPDVSVFRVVADVGTSISVPAPADALEAYRRLAEYLSVPETAPGVSSQRLDTPDVGSMSWDRSATWVAKAMAYSGAADLLRPYRKAP